MPIDPPPKRRRKTNYGKLTLYAIIVIVVAAIAYFLISFVAGALSVVNISGATSMTLTNSTTVFTLNGNEYAMQLVSSSLLSSSAHVSLTRLPVFANPTLEIYLVMNNATDVNTVGSLADLQIALTHVGNSSITVLLTPIPSGLALQPTSSRITAVQSLLPPVGSPSNTTTTTATTTTAATTTISGSSSTTTAGSSSTTTTIISTGANYTAAMNLLKTDIYYGLMANYSTTYQNAATSCNASLYNSTYSIKFGHLPDAQNSYANISALVPYKLNYTLTNPSDSVWLATYNTYSHTPSLSQGPALVVTMNLTHSQIVSSVTKGVYGGLNYSQLLSSYNASTRFHNACGIYVVSCSYPPC